MDEKKEYKSDKNERYIKVSNDWFNKSKNGKHMISDYGIDALYISSLIMFRRNYPFTNEARFTFEEVSHWYKDNRRSNIFSKLNQALNVMQDNNIFQVNMPIKDHYYLMNLDTVLCSPFRYIKITEAEINKLILLNKTTTSNAKLFVVYLIIKSYINAADGIAYPTIDTLVKDTTLSNKTIGDIIDILVDIKLIYYESRGWDVENKRNIGHIYTLWSADAKERLAPHVINGIVKRNKVDKKPVIPQDN